MDDERVVNHKNGFVFTSEIHTRLLRSSSNFRFIHRNPTQNYFVTFISSGNSIWNYIPEYIKTASSVKNYKSLYLRWYKQSLWKLVLCVVLFNYNITSWYYTVCAIIIMYIYWVLLCNVVVIIVRSNNFFVMLSSCICFGFLRSLRQIGYCQVSILVK